MKKFKIIKKITIELNVTGNSIEEIEKNIKLGKYDSTLDNLIHGKENIVIEEEENCEALTVIENGDVVELYTFQEMLDLGYVINEDNNIVFRTLTVDVNYLKEACHSEVTKNRTVFVGEQPHHKW